MFQVMCSMLLFFSFFTTVPSPGTSRGEFSETMTNHLFCDENREMLFTVVNCEGKSYEFWWNHTAPAPSFNWFLFTIDSKLFHFFDKLWIEVRAFFCRSTHLNNYLRRRENLPGFRRLRIEELEYLFFLRVLTPSASAPHGVFGAFIPIEFLASPPPCG